MTTRSPDRPALRLVPLLSAGAMLFAAACELTPRGSALSPTEPSLANILEQSDSAISERVVIRLRQGGDTVPSDSVGASVHGIQTGELQIRRVGPDGEAVSIPAQRMRLGSLSTGDAKPLFYVDGRRVETIDGIPSETIAMVEIIKGAAAVERFGQEAKDGVVQITTKGNVASGTGLAPATGARVRAVEAVGSVVVRRDTLPGGVRAVGHGTTVVLPGRVFVGKGVSAVGNSRVGETPLVITRTDGSTVHPLMVVDGKVIDAKDIPSSESIAQIEVLKGEVAVERYGEGGKDGVVVITTKK